MRPIKFRGRTPNTGFVFGDLIHYHASIAIHVIGEGIYHVAPDTVAQLVGYDKNGKEVYEGDILLDDEGEEFLAQLQGVVRWVPADKSICADMPDHLKMIPFDFAQQHTPLIFKEPNHD